MSDSMKKYRYGDEEIEVPADVSVEEVQEAWKEVHPALENATTFIAQDGVTEFHVQAGSKG